MPTLSRALSELQNDSIKNLQDRRLQVANVRWRGAYSRAKDVVRAEALQSSLTKYSDTRTSSRSHTAPDPCCLIFSLSTEATITETLLPPGLLWKSEAGAARARSSLHRTNSKKQDSLSERGKVADTSAIFSRLRFTRLTIVTANSKFEPQTHHLEIGKIRFGAPNLALLCPSTRVNSLEIVLWCTVTRVSQALFCPFGAPPQGPLYRYTKWVQA